MTGNAEWLSTERAAEALGLRPRTVYRLINDGHLVAHKFGRVIRIRQAAVDDLIAKSELAPGDLDHLLSDGRSDQHDG